MTQQILRQNRRKIFYLLVNNYQIPVQRDSKDTYIQGTLTLVPRVSPEYKGSTANVDM